MRGIVWISSRMLVNQTSHLLCLMDCVYTSGQLLPYTGGGLWRRGTCFGCYFHNALTYHQQFIPGSCTCYNFFTTTGQKLRQKLLNRFVSQLKIILLWVHFINDILASRCKYRIYIEHC